MKKWREYSDNLGDYYGWFPKKLEKNLNANLISYNATGIKLNKEEFFDFCLQQIQKEIVLDESFYIYLIVLEEVLNPNSKVERYKKCWKKISDSIELDYLQLSKEIEYRLNDKLYYASIARTQIANLNKVLKLIDAKRYNRYLFISDKNYFEGIEKNHVNLDDFIVLNSFEEIDYLQVIEKCILNHDMACCYGSDSTGVELAFIFHSLDRNKFFGYDNT